MHRRQYHAASYPGLVGGLRGASNDEQTCENCGTPIFIQSLNRKKVGTLVSGGDRCVHKRCPKSGVAR